jgi:lipid-binding SYLF domain-containing protein
MKHVFPFFSRFVIVISVFLAAGTAAHAKDTPDNERAAIRKERDNVLQELYKLNPSTKSKIEKSVGYAVFSNVGVNVIFVSAGGGHGIVVEKGTFKDTETFMKMGQAGVGFGLGVKDFRAVFVFKSAEKLKNFVEKGWDFSGEADAAAKSGEKGGAVGAAGDIAKDVEVYQITKNGIALQATLNGTKYWKDDDLN